MSGPDAGGSPGLLRGLGRFDATLLTINSVVGAGVLALPAGLALDAGRWSLAVVLVAFDARMLSVLREAKLKAETL